MNRRGFLTAAAAAAALHADDTPQLAVNGGAPVRTRPLTGPNWGPQYYDDKEQFSPDRSTKYFTSNRDDPHDSGAKKPASAGAAAQRESALCGEGMARYPQMRLCLLQPGDRRPVEKLVAWLKKVVPQGELHDVTAYLPPHVRIETQ